MSRLASRVGTRPEAIRLATADAATVWTLRVQASEAWDAVRVEVAPVTPVRAVKLAVLAVLLPGVSAADVVVKLRGMSVRSEDDSVEAAGAIDGSTLLLVPRDRKGSL